MTNASHFPRSADGRPMFYNMEGEGINIHQAGRLFADPERQIRQTIITTGYGQVTVSTVFLVIDYRMLFDDPEPILWETMTFGGPDEGFLRRYRSRGDAEAGHEEAVTACLTAIDVAGWEVVTVDKVTRVNGREVIHLEGRATPPEPAASDPTTKPIRHP